MTETFLSLSKFLTLSALFVSTLIGSVLGTPESITIEIKDKISWDTSSGKTYQVEVSNDGSGSNWEPVGEIINGDDKENELSISESDALTKLYRVVERTPGTIEPTATWSDFGGAEFNGNNYTFPNSALYWAGFANQTIDIYPLSFSNGGTIQFTAAVIDSNASQSSGPSGPGGGPGGMLSGIEDQISAQIRFRFEKNVHPDVEPSYDTSNITIKGSTESSYTVEIPPLGSNSYNSFIFYVVNQGATVRIRDVQVFDDSSVIESTHLITPNPEVLAEVSWDSQIGAEYTIQNSTNLIDWNNHGSQITGNGNQQTINLSLTEAKKFIKIVKPIYDLLAPTGSTASQSISPNAITISWNPSTTPTVIGYRIYYGTDSNNLDQTIDVGDVSSVTISNLIEGTNYFFAVSAITETEESDLNSTSIISATPNQSINLVSLYNEDTQLEEETTIYHSNALITRGADRGRGRHARESIALAGFGFGIYDKYEGGYWDGRAYEYEIIDRVGKDYFKGTDLEDSITINFTTAYPLTNAEIRAFYIGQTTWAQYAYNHDTAAGAIYSATNPGQIENAAAPRGRRNVYGVYEDSNSPVKYTTTIYPHHQNVGDLNVGDLMEIELSPFGLPTTFGGRSNYYGTAFLYVIGEGIKPWYGVGNRLHSRPLPESAMLGGKTTHHTPYSDEPTQSFKQMAYNLAPTNGQKFMSGRRLHHTNFQNGEHSEPNVPFSEHSGKLGPDFINFSCVDCHVNNGRALPKSEGSLMTKSIVRVGLDNQGTLHPVLGSVLQVQSTSGNPEKTATRTHYTETHGTYGDGTPYTLRKPNYSFGENSPEYYSVRIAPQLIGLGLLEAVDEDFIVALADPDDFDEDGISGQINALVDIETGDTRLGRFGYKASKARLKHHIASALNTDMGVNTNIYPTIDFKNMTSSLEITDDELDLLYRYVALLAVMPKRDFNNLDVIEGERLFIEANCVACHKDEMQTSAYHPLTELRNQNIRPYTDLLLHDMGPGLADNMGEELATGSEWRTAPLWNIGYTEGVSGGEAYLHDGRARNLEEAILWHGGEAENSKEEFRMMSLSDRNKLIAFLKSL